MSKLTRENAILPFDSAVDLTSKEGYFVIADASGIELVDDPSAIPIGVILVGGIAEEKTSVAISAGGLAGTVKVKLGGAVTAPGTLLKLTATGTAEASDSAPSSVLVAQALETGVADELIEAVLFKPIVL